MNKEEYISAPVDETQKWQLLHAYHVMFEGENFNFLFRPASLLARCIVQSHTKVIELLLVQVYLVSLF